MIVCVFGTTGEFIKLAPVLAELERRGAELEIVCTGQQPRQLDATIAEFGSGVPDVWLARGRRGEDLESFRDAVPWLASTIRGMIARYPALRRRARSSPSMVLVHGDTFTTVLGALFGRALRVPVAHVEAGVRTGRLLHPFPEELDRIVTSKLASIHFAPGRAAAANLKDARGEVVDTRWNTVRDALAMVPPAVDVLDRRLPERFGLVSIHRNELLQRSKALADTVEALREHARTEPVYFVDHPVTARRLDDLGLARLFDDETFVRVPKMTYFSFVGLLRASRWVVTDSGGLQQECFFLGHPCLVHRSEFEANAGGGETATLSYLSIESLKAFLADPRAHAAAGDDADVSPTRIIIDVLERRGYCPPLL